MGSPVNMEIIPACLFVFSVLETVFSLIAFDCGRNDTLKSVVSARVKPCEKISLSQTVKTNIQIIQKLPMEEIEAINCRILVTAIGYVS